jgi:hypothetical protein
MRPAKRVLDPFYWLLEISLGDLFAGQQLSVSHVGESKKQQDQNEAVRVASRRQTLFIYQNSHIHPSLFPLVTHLPPSASSRAFIREYFSSFAFFLTLINVLGKPPMSLITRTGVKMTRTFFFVSFYSLDLQFIY